MMLLMLCAGTLTDRMLRNRFQVSLLLVLFAFSLQAFAAEKVSDEELSDLAKENDTEEEPPQCATPLQTKTSLSDEDDDDDGGLPPEEEPPCVPPLEEEPTEEEPADEVETTEEVAQSDGEELEDEAEPAQLSPDLNDYNATNDTSLAGT